MQWILMACHDASCVGHFGGTITATKVLQSGYFLPSMFKDANELVKAYDRSQIVGNISMRQ